MNACGHCKQEAEWRYKDGWGVLACADWFTGECAGQPLDVAPPSVGDGRPQGRGFDEDVMNSPIPQFFLWIARPGSA